MRATSNPAFRNLPRGTGNYVGFDPQAGTPGYGNYGQPAYGGPAGPTGPGGYGVAYQQSGAVERPMTIDDVVSKTAMTLGLAIVTGVITVFTHAYWLAAPAAIVGLVLAMIIIFKRTPNAALVLSYAGVEGIVLGAITELFDNIYHGIAFQAIAGTFGVFIAMLIVYKTGAIRVTPRLTKWVIGATVGVVVVLLANFLVGMFGVDLGVRDGSPLSIAISVIIIGIAAFNLLLDFDQADRMIRMGLPARWAWYAAFGLTVTLVWLYLEILRLLSYLQRGN
ncbi:MAG TPA: Bax inhibitor-1/YccA family protein [Pseudonocardiaceae bacterium]|nr:Bax inhibitor-1/YccA family protein [Pseudonocardiaceae bacterium]